MTAPGWKAGLLAMALALAAARAQANDITAVKATPIAAESGLRAEVGSRYFVEIALQSGVDIRDGCPPGAAPVPKVISVEVIAPNRLPAGKTEFYRGDFIKGDDRCGATRLMTPLMFPLDETLMVNVRLSTGEILSKGDIRLASAESLAGMNLEKRAVRPVESEVNLLYGDKDKKLGVGWNLNADFTTLSSQVPLLRPFNVARLTFAGETSAADGSSDFKNSMTLDTSFIARLGGYDRYYAVVLKPIAFEADDGAHNINFKGSAAFAFEIPGTIGLERQIQRMLGGCRQGPGVNCTAWGMFGEVGYSANTKVRRNNGRVDRSSDYVTTAELNWNFPLTDRWVFASAYRWQSDSPDGSSSESSDIGVVYRPACQKTPGFKLSWINGEFLPGDQKRDAVRFGLTQLLGAPATGC